MKFAHLGDCHLGAWKQPEMQELSMQAFAKALEICKQEKVDFILISGDLFDTALPSVDILKEATGLLRSVKEEGIRIYCIAGSHDFSATGKTFLDVLENAGLIVNVAKEENGILKIFKDPVGAKIAGWVGKKGGLEKHDYEKFDFSQLEREDGFKIFMFHSTIDELKPRELEMIEGHSVNLLPRNFNYYAGGHIHARIEKHIPTHGLVVYPGPLMPANFLELEKLKHGGFYIVEVENNIVKPKFVPISLVDVKSCTINVDGLTALEAEEKILTSVEDWENKLLLLRIEGAINGKLSDINLKAIDEKFKDAFLILKNTSRLTTKEVEKIEVKAGTIDEIENSAFENLDENSKLLAKKLFQILDIEKDEEEKKANFEERLLKEVKPVMEKLIEK